MTTAAGTGCKKRSLILANGGLKVAFQAGVLEVWLDEAGLSFDHADGVSSGALNLAMYCQGMSGTQIADNWRMLDAHTGLGFGWPDVIRLVHGESLGSLDHFRKVVLPAWGLDWDLVRSSPRQASFNVYNFSKHQLVVLDPARMTEEYLIAGLGLPAWYPPVTIWGDTHIDAVFVTGANLEEAIRRGADELWVIWTTSDRNEWNEGFLAQYFQILETCVNSRFRATVARIEANNQALAAGLPGEFGRPIELKLLKAEVPLHYMIDISADRLTEAVNLGVYTARNWCREQGIPLKDPGRDYPRRAPVPTTTLSFSEEMRGYVTPGETSFEVGFKQGRAARRALRVQLSIHIADADRFVVDPEHEAQVQGHVEAACLGGGQLPIQAGTFNLLVHTDDPTVKYMRYRLYFGDERGQPLTLSGYKEIAEDPGLDLWRDATTLYTRVLRGHVGPEDEDQAEVVAAGIISIHLLDFLKQLTTFHAEGPTLAARASALGRFGRLFCGKLWDVYGRKVLPYGPF